MGQQSIPVLKNKFSDGKTLTGSDFGDVFDSFMHKGSRIEQAQVLGLKDELANTATKEELANVVSGLVPMGEAKDMEDLNTKPKRNNDSYFVLDQVDSDGNPYIFRYDERLNEWINTKQVVYKDVAKKTELLKLDGEFKNSVDNSNFYTSVGKNKADKRTYEKKVWAKNGQWAVSEIYISMPLFDVVAGDVLTASGHRSNSNETLRAVFLDANNDALEGQELYGNGTTQTTFTVPDGAVKVGINIAQATGIVDATNNEWANVFQLENGGVATEFTPYEIAIKSSSVYGMLPYAREKTEHTVDSWASDISNLADKSKIVIGYYYATTGKGSSSSNWSRLPLIPVEPNTEYSIVGNDVSFFGNEYSEDKASDATLVRNMPASRNVHTFITSTNTHYLGVNVGLQSADTIMINKGVPATYQPFGIGFIDRDKIYPKIAPEYSEKLQVQKTDGRIDIFIPQYDDVFLKLSYRHFEKPYRQGSVSFYDVWKLGEMWKVRRDGSIFEEVYEIISQSTEWETALHIEGSHISGQQHGYEQRVFNLFMADGVIIPENYLGSFECDKLEFVQRSNLYRFDTTDNVIIEKVCRWEVDKTGVLIDIPSLTAMEDLVVTSNAYLGMFSVPVERDGIEITNTGFNDVSYFLNDLKNLETNSKTTIGAGNNNADTMRIWKQGAEFGCKFEVLYLKEKFDNHKLYTHENGKIYHIYTRSNYDWKANEVFGATVKISFNLVEKE